MQLTDDSAIAVWHEICSRRRVALSRLNIVESSHWQSLQCMCMTIDQHSLYHQSYGSVSASQLTVTFQHYSVYLFI